MRQEHRRPGERNRDTGDQIDLPGTLGRKRQRQERIVSRLRGLDAAIAHLLEFLGLRTHPLEVPADTSVNLHVLPLRFRFGTAKGHYIGQPEIC